MAAMTRENELLDFEVKEPGEFKFSVSVTNTGGILFDLVMSFSVEGNRPCSFLAEKTLTEQPTKEDLKESFEEIKEKTKERFPENNSYHELVFWYLAKAEESIEKLEI